MPVQLGLEPGRRRGYRWFAPPRAAWSNGTSPGFVHGSIPECGMGNDMSSANDMKAAQATYNSFIGLIKVTVPILAIITIVVVKLISS